MKGELYADVREDALRQWEYIFENAGWGIVVIEPRGLFMRRVNPAYARMHGYTVSELEGGPLAETLVPESRAALGRNMRIAEENGHHVYESRHIRKDGTTFPCMIDFAVLKDQHGSVVLHAAYCQDLTDRKRLEQRVLDTLKLESLGVLAAWRMISTTC